MAAITEEGSDGRADMHFGLSLKKKKSTLSNIWLYEPEDWRTLGRVEKESTPSLRLQKPLLIKIIYYELA